MSGIAGIIRFDGQAITDTVIEEIVQLLKHRGQVTSRVVEQGVLIAFGGQLETGVPADVVLDADFFSAATAHRSFLLDYSQKGTELFNTLNADFAVAIWDSQQKALVCARDMLGVKPLYYVHQPGRFVAFASEIKALLTLQGVTVRPNEHKFREYLTWTTAYVPYSAETFYETIYSVLPGHYMQVTAGNVQVKPYWRINLEKYSGLSSSEDYSALFHQYFTEAVDHRIRGKRVVGAHLSGGLDSSSVSCAAQSLLRQQHRPTLHTFHIDTEQPAADEREYVQGGGRAVAATTPYRSPAGRCCRLCPENQPAIRPARAVYYSVQFSFERFAGRPANRLRSAANGA